MRSTTSVVLLAALALMGACDQPEPEPDPPAFDFSVTFDSGTVRLASPEDTTLLKVEVARSDAQRGRGLMQREHLAEDAGMIFVFPEVQPAESSFWMYNTLIPLSIAFIGEDHRIVSIHEMEPCTSPYPQWCEEYPAGAPFNAALEATPGFFDRVGMDVGDEVVLLD